MKQLKAFFRLLFRLDPELESATERTDRMAATMNGDTKWMMNLECRPKPRIDFEIDCNDGHTYERKK